jgi:hypothetical protein
MANLFQRIAQWLANEIIVDKLAKSRTFQNFAMKTVRGQEGAANMGRKAAEKVAEKKRLAAKETGNIFDKIKEEIRKDLAKGS